MRKASGRGRWQYTTVVEGHPAFYGELIFVGRWVSSAWLPPLCAARFGPIVLFAVAAGAMFYRMRWEYSTVAAVGAVAALILMPRMFAHAHFASLDGPLVSCWILAWAVFPGARDQGPGARGKKEENLLTVSDYRSSGPQPLAPGPWPLAPILWGIVLGATLSCKATGWFAPLPFIAFAIVYRDRVAVRTIAIGLPVALVTFFVLNPPLWCDPIHGFATFFQLNFRRADWPGFNISVQFLSRMYNLDHPLPWYNTIVWTAVTVPLGILILAGAGLIAVLRRWRDDAPGMLLVFNWLILLIVRALPGTPPHDGVRLFLPCFAFLAALAGIGCAVVLAWSVRHRRLRTAAAAIVLIYTVTAVNLFIYAPQWLSYYNLLIGGLPGATAAGMEPTYYWDGLDRSVLDWLHENTSADEKIRFAASSPENFALMQRWKTLRREFRNDAPGKFRWYVLQRRPSGYRPIDIRLIECVEPAYRKTLLGVPLVEVYPIALTGSNRLQSEK